MIDRAFLDTLYWNGRRGIELSDAERTELLWEVVTRTLRNNDGESMRQALEMARDYRTVSEVSHEGA